MNRERHVIVYVPLSLFHLSINRKKASYNSFWFIINVFWALRIGVTGTKHIMVIIRKVVQDDEKINRHFIKKIELKN